jgi:hypothetical protein
MTTSARPGYGSRLLMSSDNSHWTPVAQLKSFIPQGSRQTIVDRTNVMTPDNFTRPLPVRVDSGEIDLAGVLDPTNTGILQLGTAHATLAVYFFQAVLTDGTTYTFQAMVSEYVPFTVTYNKFLGFSAKLRVTGAITGPAGAA